MMRYLILSDIHANLEAFSAVREHSSSIGWDSILCLGDMTGYNPNPNEAVDEIRKYHDSGRLVGAILGNHDNVVIGREDPYNFNEKAKFAALWHKERVRADNKEFLSGLDDALLIDENLFIVHGSPVDPNEYLTLLFQAAISFRAMKDEGINLCFNGHTHVPCVFSLDGDEVEKETLSKEQTSIRLKPEKFYIINPGSVGQPRDGDPRSSYMIFDTGTSVVTHFRIPYDIASTQAKIVEAGLPQDLADRLSLGF